MELNMSSQSSVDKSSAEYKRDYIKAYKNDKRSQNRPYEQALSSNYNKIGYDRKKGTLNEVWLAKYGVVYPCIVEIKKQLELIVLLHRGNFKEDILTMIENILV